MNRLPAYRLPSYRYRTVAAGVAALGLVLGSSFGVGVACGRGDTADTQSGTNATTTQPFGNINPGQFPTVGAQGNATTGRITAINGNTVTVQTAQGEVKVDLTDSTTVTTTTEAKASDLKVGMTVVASGSKKDDGSVAATSLSQVTAALQALLGGAGRGLPGASGTAAGGRTPTAPAGTPPAR